MALLPIVTLTGTSILRYIGTFDAKARSGLVYDTCAFGRTGRMEVETLDHDESPRVTSFRAITFRPDSSGRSHTGTLISQRYHPMRFRPDVEQN